MISEESFKAEVNNRKKDITKKARNSPGRKSRSGLCTSSSTRIASLTPVSRTLSTIVASAGQSFPDRLAEVGAQAQQLVENYDIMDEELRDGALARKRSPSYISPTHCPEAKKSLTENLQTKPKKVNNNRISAHPPIPPGIQYEIPVVGSFQVRNCDPG